MGEVYKATHRTLGRPATNKLIRPEMIAAADPAGAQLAVMRFRREGEAAANLRSPHTVELYDFVKVLDFGLVKPIADESIERSLNSPGHAGDHGSYKGVQLRIVERLRRPPWFNADRRRQHGRTNRRHSVGYALS
jgi:serine/threonine protein kinase